MYQEIEVITQIDQVIELWKKENEIEVTKIEQIIEDKLSCLPKNKKEYYQEYYQIILYNHKKEKKLEAISNKGYSEYAPDLVFLIEYKKQIQESLRVRWDRKDFNKLQTIQTILSNTSHHLKKHFNHSNNHKYLKEKLQREGYF